MDAVNYSETHFNELKSKMSIIVKNIGFNPQTVAFIPTCGLTGDNLTVKSSNTTWYTGKTLLQVLNTLPNPTSPADKPLRLPVCDVYKIGGIGTVPVGRVEYGILRTGMPIIFAPSNILTEVKSVELHIESDHAVPGDNPGFNVKRVLAKDLKRGYVCGDPKNNPPKETECFVALILVLSHTGKLENGYTAQMSCHTTQATCKFSLLAKYDRRTGQKLQEFPAFLKTGDCGLVRMTPTKPICVERFRDYPTLGRFVCRNQQNKVLGIIKHVVKKGFCIATSH